jgi:NifU-like protein involved in Fe-S cluster formation
MTLTNRRVADPYVLAKPSDCKPNAQPAYNFNRQWDKGWESGSILSMVDLEDIYSERVLALSANMPRAGRLTSPDATATAYSKLCGSRITVDLSMRDGIVTDYAQDVRACLLGQTSAAVMGAQIVGSTAAELREVAAAMRAMLKENGDPPRGRWADLAILEMVRDYKARHASTLLVFDAVEDAIAQIENRPQQACSNF